MAIRVRKDGTMWCAAHTQEQPGDTYIDDGLHYEMSVKHGVIVALPMPGHLDNPQWWWVGNAPDGLTTSVDHPMNTPASAGDDLVAVSWRYRGPRGGWITVEEKPTGWPSEPLYSASQLAALKAERDGLAKDLSAQVAGHRETARQGTEALMRANNASAKLDEAEERARKHWQAFRDLRLDIIGHGPMCRDCADFDGRCQGNGPPCDPDEAVAEQIATWKAAEARLKAAHEALQQAFGFLGGIDGAVGVRAAVAAALGDAMGNPSLIEQAFRDGLSYGSNTENADPDLAWKQSRLNPERQEVGGNKPS